MYASFYNLKKEAFHITPDPEFLFLSPSHKEALGSIIYGVRHRKGFVSITGEVGVGKTTIIRSYLEQSDSRKLKVIYVFNANVSFTDLLKTIFQELGITATAGSDFDLVNELHEVLIEEYKSGVNVVLIIDEAQNMPVKTLENLRMLSNLETSTDKLIQIVFCGQPEFEQLLDTKELRQLRQRIAVKATILPLTDEQSVEYILHRLSRVSTGKTSIFTDGALKSIVREACGIPRIINILCENALVTALGYGKKQINGKIISEVIADFTGIKKKKSLRYVFAFTVIALIVLCALLAYLYGGLPADISARQRTAAGGAVRNTAARNVDVKTDVSADPVKASPEADGGGPGKKAPDPTDDGFPVEKTVRKGDTLSGLVEQVYGASSKRLILLVKDGNSGIHDVNRLSIGQKIVFPAREKRSGRRHE